MSKTYQWNNEKNRLLYEERGISFERIVIAILGDELLDIIAHHNPEKFGHQRIFVLNINEYVYLVPFVENDDVIFLKTIIPSRKMTNHYLGGKKDK